MKAPDLAVFPKEVLEFQLARTNYLFLIDEVGEFTIDKEVETHLLGERIYLIKKKDIDINEYVLKHYEDSTSVDPNSQMKEAVERFQYEV